MRSASFLAAAAALLCHSTSGHAYNLVEDYFDSAGFFSHFDFFTSGDPTHGLVNYVDEGFASSNGMISSTSNSAWMGTDSTTILGGNQGRNSIRLTAKNAYTHMLVIIQVAKMPVSCGSWPAFWTTNQGNWPYSGEIDIIEGVHNQQFNQMTLHTNDGCSASGAGDGMAQPITSSCEGNNGCGFLSNTPASFSQANSDGGGVWAMEWTSNGISVWFNPSGNPFDNNPDPSTFGQPQMNVPNGGNCNVDQHFASHNIIFDWTFCGDWAGQDSIWQNSGCSSSQYPTCQSFVQGNPGAYSGVGWDVRYLKVFQQ